MIILTKHRYKSRKRNWNYSSRWKQIYMGNFKLKKIEIG